MHSFTLLKYYIFYYLILKFKSKKKIKKNDKDGRPTHFSWVGSTIPLVQGGGSTNPRRLDGVVWPPCHFF
jgi:hypothetical protein